MATKVVCGWAGAVIKKANSSVWAGAVIQRITKHAKKANGDQPANIVDYRVTCTRLKEDNCCKLK